MIVRKRNGNAAQPLSCSPVPGTPHKNEPMKTVFAACLLCIPLSLCAPLAIANDDSNLCQLNLSKVRDMRTARADVSDTLKGELDTLIHRAESAYQRHSDDGARECVSLTNQALQKLQSH